MPDTVYVVRGEDSYLAESDPAAWTDVIDFAAQYETAAEAKAAMNAADRQTTRKLEIRKVAKPRPPSATLI